MPQSNSFRFCWILAWLLLTTSASLVFGRQEENDKIIPHESKERIISIGKNCTFDQWTFGWQCNERCIPWYFVCDGNESCFPDDSDEKEGCQLYSETGCHSWETKKYTKCPHSHRCVLDIATECEAASAEPENPSSSDPEEDLTDCPMETRWRCHNGLCISKVDVCDGYKNCADGSDEIFGCSLFPDTGCKSWGGLKHVKCRQNETDEEICTLPKFLETDCRQCDNLEEWRCNSGYCIDRNKTQDGIPDCLDGSDELSNFCFLHWWKSGPPQCSMHWWVLAMSVLTMSGIAVLISFITRNLAHKTGLLHCRYCQLTEQKAELTRKTSRKPAVAAINKCSKNYDAVDYYPAPASGDIRRLKNEQKIEKDDYKLPMTLINILEKGDCWRKNSLYGIHDEKGKKLYAGVHQSVEMYRNLYHYLVYRYASPARFHRVISKLLDWEMDFHNNDRSEVTKCWRLHLGSSRILKDVLEASESDSYNANSFYNAYWLPFKNAVRKCRQETTAVPKPIRSCLNGFNRLYNMTYYALRPFSGASAFYFDICKDITYAMIIHNALVDMTAKIQDGYDFETAMIIFLILALVIVQVLFMILSAITSAQLFAPCEHLAKPRLLNRIRVFGALLGPLMPAVILANYVYYQEQVYSLQRDLQSHGTLEYDLGADEEAEAKEIQAEAKIDIESDPCKVSLFRKIEKMSYKAALHRRFYSYYRVIQAAIESFVVVNVLILIVLVCPRPGRAINLSRGIEAKIAQFVGFRVGDEAGNSSIFEQLNLIRDISFVSSIIYSLIMVISALVRYVYQNKNGNMTIKGQLCYGVYVACHLVTRLALSISFFSTAEMPRNPDSSAEGPVITLLPASILCLVFFIVQFFAIFAFKFYKIPEFAKAPIAEQLVHVLANTLVVIPFMTWDRIQPKDQEAEEVIRLTRQKRQSSTTSLDILVSPSKPKQEFKKGHFRNKSESAAAQTQALFSAIDHDHLMMRRLETLPSVPKGDEIDALSPSKRKKAEKIANSLLPDFSSPIRKKRHFEEILELWWKNPEQDLDFEKIKAKLLLSENDVNEAENVFKMMITNGYINKKMFNPRRTKTEYFWLFLLQLVIHACALVIEMVNGGVKTTNGLYYSWDVRLGSFAIGLIFLAMYYKKYHVLKNLIPVDFCICGWSLRMCPILCCFKKDKPMQAIPDEEELEKCLDTPKDTQTQT